jgi:ABC-type dipeptide/oligopeptide/nickel transport system permease component
MSFPRYVLRRTLSAIALMFVVASAAQLLAQLAPGDYTSRFGMAPGQAAAERHRLGLDLPIAQQYGRWLRHSVTLDFGQSFEYQRPVTELVGERARNTALLAATALALATLIGIPCGVFTGSRRGLLASMIRGTSLLLLSVPPLVSALVLLTIAARTGWLPVSGMGGVSHLVIPAFSLALPVAATLERLQSQSIAESLASPATLAARARGRRYGRLVWRHAWRRSLGPILAIYGVIIGTLFSGSFAVELVTSWPGLGLLMLDALRARDTYLVGGCAAAGAAFLAAGVLAADLTHALVDPRVERSLT